MTTTDPQPFAYDLVAAAAATHLSRDYLFQQIKAGNLRARLVGRKYLIRVDDLADWFDRQPEAV